MIARLVSQSEEDGTLGILSCAVLPSAKSGEFYGPGMGMMASKGRAKAYPLESKYDNAATRTLIWEKVAQPLGHHSISKGCGFLRE